MAEAELEQALTMDFGQCDAALYLGGVRSEMNAYPGAIAALNQATQCFDLALAVRRTAMAAVENSASSPTTKARDLARHHRAIGTIEKRRQDALNAMARLKNVTR